MLNEPITEEPAATPAPTPSGFGGLGGLGGLGGDNVPTPQQLQQLMQSLTPEQHAQMAAQVGMTPEQLQQLSQMLSVMPPEAMQQMMAQMGAGGLGGNNEGGGATHRITLTEEEAAAVNRLCDMGFDRTEAVQAYLACDKNEALAANFLMDSMSGDYGGGAGYGGNADDSNDDIYG